MGKRSLGKHRKKLQCAIEAIIVLLAQCFNFSCTNKSVDGNAIATPYTYSTRHQFEDTQ